MAVVLKTNGARIYVEPNGTFFNAEQLQHIIDGNIKIIALGNISLVVDTAGQEKCLPKNGYASTIISAFTFPEKKEILGDVILCRTKQIQLNYDPNRQTNQTKKRTHRLHAKA